MDINKIAIGDDPPNSLNVIIEVPIGGEPVKYEFDKASGALFVDRILHTPMRYPANYGFVPHTLCGDGDPLDALVVSRSPFIAQAAREDGRVLEHGHLDPAETVQAADSVERGDDMVKTIRRLADEALRAAHGLGESHDGGG